MNVNGLWSPPICVKNEVSDTDEVLYFLEFYFISLLKTEVKFGKIKKSMKR